MRKEELRKLRALPATKEMMLKGKRFTEETKKVWYYNEPITKIIPDYDVLLRVQNLNGYIKIAVFLPEKMRKNIKTPRYEIFLNVQGCEYLTRELNDEGKEARWLTSMVNNLDGVDAFSYYYSIKRPKVFISRDGMNTLNGLNLQKDEHQSSKGLDRLRYWQQEQKDEQRKRKEERQQAPWDADMKLIPELRKGFKEWMRKEAASEYYMIYEYDPRGQTKGYCSKCKKYVKIENPKHNKETKCPNCKAKATFKAHSKIQTLATPCYVAEIIQKFNGGIVVRSFQQYQKYRECKYTDPYIATHEYYRTMIFDNGIVKKYRWDLYKNRFHRWVPDQYGEYRAKTKLYKRNLTHLKKYTMLKRSAIDLWPTLPMQASKYIEVEKGNPAVEMLAKIGMFRLAEGLINVRYDKNLLNQDATEISKMLKIDKSRLKRLKEMDGNIYSLYWMQYEKMADTIWPDEMIKDFGKAMFKTSVFGFLDAPISFVKCHNYLKKQAAMMDESLNQALTTWRDYINMADKLKMNTKCDQIVRPKNLKYAHDELVLIIQQAGLEKQTKEIEKKWPKVNSQLPKLQKFEYTKGEYTIVAPKSVLDIVTEGTLLRHCVHTCDYYFDRIQKDESYLFFLRRSKQPDMPWYTLEVEPSGNIRQKRTTGDNQNQDFQKAVDFLKKWQKYFQKQLTEEEKRLGEKSNELREENYKNLRKNGNRVWHGKLAGKLLADVLEQDFMAAGL